MPQTPNDNDRISHHPPDTDIDQYVENCNFRIERMSDEGIWLAAYTHDGEKPDHHYDITVTENGGLHVTHREEEPPETES
jgi:hypothetical protein